jgi:hypothetical protein
MNGKQAKRIRKECFGDDAPTDRKHYIHKGTGEIIADEKRHRFQVAKKRFQMNEVDSDIKRKEKARKVMNRKKKLRQAWEAKQIQTEQ